MPTIKSAHNLPAASAAESHQVCCSSKRVIWSLSPNPIALRAWHKTEWFHVWKVCLALEEFVGESGAYHRWNEVCWWPALRQQPVAWPALYFQICIHSDSDTTMFLLPFTCLFRVLLMLPNSKLSGVLFITGRRCASMVSWTRFFSSFVLCSATKHTRPTAVSNSQITADALIEVVLQWQQGNEVLAGKAGLECIQLMPAGKAAAYEVACTAL